LPRRRPSRSCSRRLAHKPIHELRGCFRENDNSYGAPAECPDDSLCRGVVVVKHIIYQYQAYVRASAPLVRYMHANHVKPDACMGIVLLHLEVDVPQRAQAFQFSSTWGL
jgi:hypothetical protein